VLERQANGTRQRAGRRDGAERVNIQPIQTVYKGYKFRSRLEARWAVFFDEMGVRFEYEPEGFELPSGRYLPDFYLPDGNSYIEVKARRSEEPAKMPAVGIIPREQQLALELSEQIRSRVAVSYGDPLAALGEDADGMVHFHSGSPQPMIDLYHELVRAAVRKAKAHPEYGKVSEVLLAAALKARQARFEHGEGGA
jgi:hypothetical protein